MNCFQMWMDFMLLNFQTQQHTSGFVNPNIFTSPRNHNVLRPCWSLAIMEWVTWPALFRSGDARFTDKRYEWCFNFFQWYTTLIRIKIWVSCGLEVKESEGPWVIFWTARGTSMLNALFFMKLSVTLNFPKMNWSIRIWKTCKSSISNAIK